MKYKSIYTYTAIIILIGIFFYFLSGRKTASNPEDGENNFTHIPNDEIHTGIQSGTEMPGKSNVNKEFVQKLEALKIAVESNPKDTMKVREYADLLGMAHKGADAIKLYKLILEKDPGRIDLYHKLTLLYFAAEQFDEAEAATSKLLKLDPENLEAKYNSGAIAAERGDLPKAKIIWTEILENYPGTKAADFASQSLSRMD